MSLILGIESSCDDTAVAVLDGISIRSNLVASQLNLHRKWGGVVPEAAARAHVEAILPVVQEALSAADRRMADLNAIAVTNRPGLIGSLSVGVAFAKGLALGLGIPWIGIHHLEGHLWSVLATDSTYTGSSVTLIVSGGHTELVHVKGLGDYEVLGATRDDAAGEAFDKCARLLGLPAPGGLSIQRAATDYKGPLYSLPQARVGPREFSFSGLKTAVSHLVAREGAGLQIAKAAASIQHAIVEPLVEKTILTAQDLGVSTIAVGGGVSANIYLRDRLLAESERNGFRFLAAPLELCTDNGAMIALVGAKRLALGQSSSFDEDVMPSGPLPGP